MTSIEGWDWYQYKELDSTNSQAEIISSQISPGCKFVVTADNQIQGRGRLGRKWVSSVGNLYFSQCIEVPLNKLGQVIFVVSLSLAETIKSYNNKLCVEIKWPNDVLLDGAKVSGCLLEKGADEYLIIGTGVNIFSLPNIGNTAYNITSIKNAGINTDKNEFLIRYLRVFNKNYDLWENKGFQVVKDKWLSFAKGIGNNICVKGINSETSGIFLGVDENGLLLLKRCDTIEKIYAGDIFYI